MTVYGKGIRIVIVIMCISMSCIVAHASSNSWESSVDQAFFRMAGRSISQARETAGEVVDVNYGDIDVYCSTRNGYTFGIDDIEPSGDTIIARVYTQFNELFTDKTLSERGRIAILEKHCQKVSEDYVSIYTHDDGTEEMAYEVVYIYADRYRIDIQNRWDGQRNLPGESSVIISFFGDDVDAPVYTGIDETYEEDIEVATQEYEDTQEYSNTQEYEDTDEILESNIEEYRAYDRDVKYNIGDDVALTLPGKYYLSDTTGTSVPYIDLQLGGTCLIGEETRTQYLRNVEKGIYRDVISLSKRSCTYRVVSNNVELVFKTNTGEFVVPILIIDEGALYLNEEMNADSLYMTKLKLLAGEYRLLNEVNKPVPEVVVKEYEISVIEGAKIRDNVWVKAPSGTTIFAAQVNIVRANNEAEGIEFFRKEGRNGTYLSLESVISSIPSSGAVQAREGYVTGQSEMQMLPGSYYIDIFVSSSRGAMADRVRISLTIEQQIEQQGEPFQGGTRVEPTQDFAIEENKASLPKPIIKPTEWSIVATQGDVISLCGSMNQEGGKLKNIQINIVRADDMSVGIEYARYENVGVSSFDLAQVKSISTTGMLKARSGFTNQQPSIEMVPGEYIIRIFATNEQDAGADEAQISLRITTQARGTVTETNREGYLRVLANGMELGEVLTSGYIGGRGTTLAIESDVEWFISSDVEWIVSIPTRGSENGSFFMNVAQNSDASKRTGHLTISGGNVKRVVSLVQSGIPVALQGARVDHASTDTNVSQNTTGAVSSNVDPLYVQWSAYVQGENNLRLYQEPNYNPQHGSVFIYDRPIVIGEADDWYYVKNEITVGINQGQYKYGYVLKEYLGRKRWVDNLSKYVVYRRDGGRGSFRAGDVEKMVEIYEITSAFNGGCIISGESAIINVYSSSVGYSDPQLSIRLNLSGYSDLEGVNGEILDSSGRTIDYINTTRLDGKLYIDVHKFVAMMGYKIMGSSVIYDNKAEYERLWSNAVSEIGNIWSNFYSMRIPNMGVVTEMLMSGGGISSIVDAANDLYEVLDGGIVDGSEIVQRIVSDVMGQVESETNASWMAYLEVWEGFVGVVDLVGFSESEKGVAFDAIFNMTQETKNQLLGSIVLNNAPPSSDEIRAMGAAIGKPNITYAQLIGIKRFIEAYDAALVGAKAIGIILRVNSKVEYFNQIALNSRDETVARLNVIADLTSDVRLQKDIRIFIRDISDPKYASLWIVADESIRNVTDADKVVKALTASFKMVDKYISANVLKKAIVGLEKVRSTIANNPVAQGISSADTLFSLPSIILSVSGHDTPTIVAAKKQYNAVQKLFKAEFDVVTGYKHIGATEEAMQHMRLCATYVNVMCDIMVELLRASKADTTLMDELKTKNIHLMGTLEILWPLVKA